MTRGRITKLIGGQYTVKDERGKAVVLKPLGKFRHLDLSPKVGDIVTFDAERIVSMEPRKNELLRPPIANVDQAILIHSAKEPDFSFTLLDRFLVMVEHSGIDPLIVVTKTDLLDTEEMDQLRADLAHYEKHYTVYYTTVHDNATLEVLKPTIKDCVSVFAGQTGSGKSSLLNALDIQLKLQTDAISKALGRGKHTTRHTELLEVHGGLVADTPGFSKLAFFDLDEADLPQYYPDFLAVADNCKFRGCRHINEPGCAVKEAVDNGRIPTQRYARYRFIYEEVNTTEKTYRKKG